MPKTDKWIPGLSLCREFLEGISKHNVDDAYNAMSQLSWDWGEKNRFQYICLELIYLRKKGKIRESTCGELQITINKLLGGNGSDLSLSFGDWYIKHVCSEGYYTHERVSIRKPWINWMVQQLHLLKIHHGV